MAGETKITVIGNVTGDPEVRYTPSGAAVANFTVASTPRRFDRNANEFVDGDPLFMRCSVWREQAENVVESIVKGTRVIVVGDLVQRSYETREGEKRTVVEMQVDEVAVSLRWAVAQARRSDGAGQRRSFREQPAPQTSTPAADPWASSSSQFTDEPPF